MHDFVKEWQGVAEVQGLTPETTIGAAILAAAQLLAAPASTPQRKPLGLENTILETITYHRETVESGLLCRCGLRKDETKLTYPLHLTSEITRAVNG